MSRIIAIASANAHKLREIREIVEPLGFLCVDLSSWPELGDLPETADTFEGNALQKARALFEHSGRLALADDSGIEVDALQGRPGVRSKRYTPEGTASSNNTALLSELGASSDRRARFRCVLAAVGPTGEATIEGRCEGSIALAPRGDGGFGYDPLFLPDETPGLTMAELPSDQKNAISHRGRAFCRVPELLRLLER